MQLTARLPIMLFGITLLVTMGVTSIMPLLPFLATTFDVSLATSALLITAFAVPGMLFTPLLGVWADRYGRKALLVPALLLFGVAGVGCAFSPSFEILLFFRTIQGIGAAPLGLLYTTIVADTWEKEERARMMSYCATALGLGTGLSPAIGGALAILHWRLPFLLSLLALPVAWLAFKAPLLKPKENSTLREYLRLTLACIAKPRTKNILLLNLLGSIMLFGPIITCLPVLADQNFAASPFVIGLILACASLMAGLVASQLSRFYSRYTTQHILYFGQFAYLVCFIALPFAPNLVLMAVCIAIYGIGQGINMPIVGTLLSGQAPAEQRASLLAVNSIFLRFAQAFAPMFFSLVASQTTPNIAIACGALLVVLTLWTLGKTDVPSVTG